jgi:hypothetical protein
MILPQIKKVATNNVIPVIPMAVAAVVTHGLVVNRRETIEMIAPRITMAKPITQMMAQLPIKTGRRMILKINPITDKTIPIIAAVKVLNNI